MWKSCSEIAFEEAQFQDGSVSFYWHWCYCSTKWMKIILGAFHVFPKFKNEVWNIAVSERGGLGDTVQELDKWHLKIACEDINIPFGGFLFKRFPALTYRHISQGFDCCCGDTLWWWNQYKICMHNFDFKLPRIENPCSCRILHWTLWLIWTLGWLWVCLSVLEGLWTPFMRVHAQIHNERTVDSHIWLFERSCK